MNTTKKIELHKIFWDEWKYRVNNLWKRLIQFFVAILFVSTLPITYQVFDGITLPNHSLYVFPVIGILLTTVFLWYCISETYRIYATDIKLNKIIKSVYGEEYTKIGLVPIKEKNRQKNKKPFKIFTIPILVWIPILFSIIEMLISVYMIIVISCGYL